MNKFLLISLCTIVSVFTFAQEKAEYLAGAVPEVDGKVVFSRTVKVKNDISKATLFDLMYKWANKKYNNENSEKGLTNRVLLSDKEQGDIACGGEQYLVFKKNAFVLDRAKMSYQLLLAIDQGKCDVIVRNIRYDYSDNKEVIPAEEMITDNVALNKNGDKLNRYFDKFRIQTIDSLNAIMTGIDVYLNGTNTSGAVASVSTVPVVNEPVQQSVSPVVNNDITPISVAGSLSTDMPGFKRVSADKIPGNYIKLLSDWTLITSGTTDQTNVMTASWGGLGTFWEKPVAFCFLNPTRYSVQMMDKGEYYTISFYTEAYKEALRYCGSVSGRTTDKIKGSGLTPIKTPSGATAFAEAWMILECKKIVSQQMSSDAVVDKNLPNDWTKDGFHKMYIGEILNVWIK
ncbi:DUF4468 domain-containing protein [Dysgonomonas sp. Marseille-P4677]|uniref:DUF4468 domain-containing protein n=1 Tax=Dysgonomonas sp. Marseille-P4677 TaxID=2364790 RepID=UPI00191466B4|nr:DUF4468 domain-containing protein [Dysgonomonas sp. Marseille-P4677]MBK5722371.1 DUF4468 domain-containing protein [Dysgonomonas sp. Marseille-P4677]